MKTFEKHDKVMNILEKMRDIAVQELKPLRVALTVLYGSQNYNLDTAHSDVDVMCYVVPTADMLINNVNTQRLIKTEYGNITVKDLREFPTLISKMNPTALETLFTDYHIEHLEGTSFRNYKKLGNQILLGNLPGFYWATQGTAHNKYKATFKETNLTSSEIKTYGYSPKNLMHGIRLTEMLEAVKDTSGDNDFDFKNVLSLEGYRRDNIFYYRTPRIPTNKLQREQAVKVVNNTILIGDEGLRNMKDFYISQPKDDTAINKLFELVKQEIKISLRKELSE